MLSCPLKQQKQTNMISTLCTRTLDPTPSSKLPELVTPLKGHSSCPLTLSVPSERFGNDKNVEATQQQSTRINIRHSCPRLKKNKNFCLESKDFVCFLCCVSNISGYKEMPHMSCFTNVLLFERKETNKQKTCPLAEFFLDLWCNQPWQWSEEGCCKSALGVWLNPCMNT